MQTRILQLLLYLYSLVAASPEAGDYRAEKPASLILGAAEPPPSPSSMPSFNSPMREALDKDLHRDSCLFTRYVKLGMLSQSGSESWGTLEAMSCRIPLEVHGEDVRFVPFSRLSLWTLSVSWRSLMWSLFFLFKFLPLACCRVPVACRQQWWSSKPYCKTCWVIEWFQACYIDFHFHKERRPKSEVCLRDRWD